MIASGNGPMIATVRVDNPKIGVPLVRHRIGEPPDVHNLFPVGRDLRVGGNLQLKLIHCGELAAGVLR
jgi:hypothetical protein